MSLWNSPLSSSFVSRISCRFSSLCLALSSLHNLLRFWVVTFLLITNLSTSSGWSAHFQSQKAFFFSPTACLIAGVHTFSLGFLSGLSLCGNMEALVSTNISFIFWILVSRDANELTSPDTLGSKPVTFCSYSYLLIFCHFTFVVLQVSLAFCSAWDNSVCKLQHMGRWSETSVPIPSSLQTSTIFLSTCAG